MGTGLESLLELLKLRKGITEEDGIRELLEAYMNVVDIRDNDIEAHYDDFLKGGDKEAILEHIDDVLLDPGWYRQSYRLAELMREALPYFEIEQRMVARFGFDVIENMEADQYEIVQHYGPRLDRMPNRAFAISLHPNYHRDLTNEVLSEVKVDAKGDTRLSKKSKDVLRVLGYPNPKIKEMIHLQGAGVRQQIKEKANRIRQERKERQIVNRKTKKKKQPTPSTSPSQQSTPSSSSTSSSPWVIPGYEQAKRKKKTVPLTELPFNKAHTQFKKMAGRRFPVERIKTRMSAFSAKTGEELTQELEKHALKVLKDKLSKNTTAVPLLHEFVSEEKRDELLTSFFNRNTNILNGSLSGLVRTSRVLKKVLNATSQEINQAAAEKLAEYIAEQGGLKQVEDLSGYAHKKAEIHMTSHVVERAQERIDSELEEEDMIRLFKSFGVDLPHPQEADVKFRVVAHEGDYLVFPFKIEEGVYHPLTVYKSHKPVR